MEEESPIVDRVFSLRCIEHVLPNLQWLYWSAAWEDQRSDGRGSSFKHWPSDRSVYIWYYPSDVMLPPVKLSGNDFKHTAIGRKKIVSVFWSKLLVTRFLLNCFKKATFYEFFQTFQSFGFWYYIQHHTHSNLGAKSGGKRAINNSVCISFSVEGTSNQWGAGPSVRDQRIDPDSAGPDSGESIVFEPIGVPVLQPHVPRMEEGVSLFDWWC